MTATPPPPAQYVPPAQPAGPAPGVKYAGHVARFLAYLVDGFILGIVIWILVVVLGLVVAAFASAGSDAATALSLVVTVAAVFAVSLGYFPYFWSRSGQTPGLRMLRLKVVRANDGGPLTSGQAVLRLIGLWISFAVFYLGVLWILVDSQRQGWHDKIASTVVIEVP